MPDIFSQGLGFLQSIYARTFPSPMGIGSQLGVSGGVMAGQQQSMPGEALGAFGSSAGMFEAQGLAGSASASSGHAFRVPQHIYRSVILMADSFVGAKLNDKPVQDLSMALAHGGRVFVQNRAVHPRFVTVEIKSGDHWHKAYMHNGKWHVFGMENCKVQLRHGMLHVHINGVEVKATAVRFEVDSL